MSRGKSSIKSFLRCNFDTILHIVGQWPDLRRHVRRIVKAGSRRISFLRRGAKDIEAGLVLKLFLIFRPILASLYLNS